MGSEPQTEDVMGIKTEDDDAENVDLPAPETAESHQQSLQSEDGRSEESEESATETINLKELISKSKNKCLTFHVGSEGKKVQFQKPFMMEVCPIFQQTSYKETAHLKVILDASGRLKHFLIPNCDPNALKKFTGYLKQPVNLLKASITTAMEFFKFSKIFFTLPEDFGGFEHCKLNIERAMQRNKRCALKFLPEFIQFGDRELKDSALRSIQRTRWTWKELFNCEEWADLDCDSLKEILNFGLPAFNLDIFDGVWRWTEHRERKRQAEFGEELVEMEGEWIAKQQKLLGIEVPPIDPSVWADSLYHDRIQGYMKETSPYCDCSSSSSDSSDGAISPPTTPKARVANNTEKRTLKNNSTEDEPPNKVQKMAEIKPRRPGPASRTNYIPTPTPTPESPNCCDPSTPETQPIPIDEPVEPIDEPVVEERVKQLPQIKKIDDDETPETQMDEPARPAEPIDEPAKPIDEPVVEKRPQNKKINDDDAVANQVPKAPVAQASGSGCLSTTPKQKEVPAVPSKQKKSGVVNSLNSSDSEDEDYNPKPENTSSEDENDDTDGSDVTNSNHTEDSDASDGHGSDTNKNATDNPCGNEDSHATIVTDATADSSASAEDSDSEDDSDFKDDSMLDDAVEIDYLELLLKQKGKVQTSDEFYSSYNAKLPIELNRITAISPANPVLLCLPSDKKSKPLFLPSLKEFRVSYILQKSSQLQALLPSLSSSPLPFFHQVKEHESNIGELWKRGLNIHMTLNGVIMLSMDPQKSSLIMTELCPITYQIIADWMRKFNPPLKHLLLRKISIYSLDYLPSSLESLTLTNISSDGFGNFEGFISDVVEKCKNLKELSISTKPTSWPSKLDVGLSKSLKKLAASGMQLCCSKESNLEELYLKDFAIDKEIIDRIPILLPYLKRVKLQGKVDAKIATRFIWLMKFLNLEYLGVSGFLFNRGQFWNGLQLSLGPKCNSFVLKNVEKTSKKEGGGRIAQLSKLKKMDRKKFELEGFNDYNSNLFYDDRDVFTKRIELLKRKYEMQL